MNILYVTTIGATMEFFLKFIENLTKEGHTVDLAANVSDRDVHDYYRVLGCRIYPLSCSRSPLRADNIKAIQQIKKIVKEHQYDIVHCHTPVAAMCTRLACIGARKRGTNVFYTAHGFHFFKGAPLKNWLLYYPVEKVCSYFTDTLITINQEDYNLAKKKMKARQIAYVPGVGVDTKRFSDIASDKSRMRIQSGIPEDAILLLSVGELNKNKNHQIIIWALAHLQDPRIHYAVAGIGNQQEELQKLSKKLNVENQVHLLGYRQDVAELCKCADIFCQPSYREGLGVAALEAMSCGLPLITSNVHGINDYSENGLSGYKCAPDDREGFAQAIRMLADSPMDRKNMGAYNFRVVQRFDISNILPEMKRLYQL